MSAENHYNEQQTEKKSIEQPRKLSSIDVTKIYKDLLKHKGLYFKVLPVAFVLAVIYTLAIPNYYSCIVKLSPELSSSRTNSRFSQLHRLQD